MNIYPFFFFFFSIIPYFLKKVRGQPGRDLEILILNLTSAELL